MGLKTQSLAFWVSIIPPDHQTLDHCHIHTIPRRKHVLMHSKFRDHNGHQIEQWVEFLTIRAYLHIPSPSKFNIVPMETDRLMDKMGSEPNLSVKQSVTIHTM